jgi:hypothetical protein
MVVNIQKINNIVSSAPLTLRKKDEGNITEDIMGMFEVEGKHLNKNK